MTKKEVKPIILEEEIDEGEVDEEMIKHLLEEKDED